MKSQVESSYIFNRILMSFLFPLAIVIGIISYIYNEEKKSDLNMLMLGEHLEVTFEKNLMLSLFESYYSDIFFLQEMNDLYEFFPDNDSTFKHHHNFYSFIKQKKIYDQIRLINTEGFETFRINYNDGAPEIVHSDSLQYKGDHPYFTEAMRLNHGQMYVSQLDLNVEHFVPQDKPMIRFAMPIFSESGDRKGIVVLNYLARHMLNNLMGLERSGERYLMLVNDDGYWMHGMQVEDEWGWMFEDRRDRKFQTDFPEEWVDISSRDSGTIISNNGLFIYTKVQPLVESGNISLNCPNCEEICWYIVSYVPYDIMMSSSKRLFLRLAALTSLLAVFLAVSSFFYTTAGIKRKMAENALRDAAHRDALTGLSNRRDFIEKFEYELVRFERSGKPFSMILCDIDHFKNVNDTHGHDCGDAILVQIAELLDDTLRAQDIIGRWGGEEFVVLLPETDIDQGAVTAEKIRCAIESNTFTFNDLKLSITMSFGITEYLMNQMLDECVKNADIGLYEAKRSGRNRVVKIDAKPK